MLKKLFSISLFIFGIANVKAGDQKRPIIETVDETIVDGGAGIKVPGTGTTTATAPAQVITLFNPHSLSTQRPRTEEEATRAGELEKKRRLAAQLSEQEKLQQLKAETAVIKAAKEEAKSLVDPLHVQMKDVAINGVKKGVVKGTSDVIAAAIFGAAIKTWECAWEIPSYCSAQGRAKKRERQLLIKSIAEDNTKFEAATARANRLAAEFQLSQVEREFGQQKDFQEKKPTTTSKNKSPEKIEPQQPQPPKAAPLSALAFDQALEKSLESQDPYSTVACEQALDRALEARDTNENKRLPASTDQNSPAAPAA